MPTRAARLALAAVLLAMPAAAQDHSPVFECEVERQIGLLDPDLPAWQTLVLPSYRGFAFDTASGILSWRRRGTGELVSPRRWHITQRGGSGQDWVAVIGWTSLDGGRQQILRIRNWGSTPGRFVIFDFLGGATMGACR